MENFGLDLDFDLIWPDSENLLQSLIGPDSAEWQMPLGSLPISHVEQKINGIAFGSPDTLEDRGLSVGAISSGGGHRAVQDVTNLINDSVGAPHFT